MRAVELPSPAAIRRRISPLPVTLAALLGLLALELTTFAPDLAPATATADTRPFADVLPAAAPADAAATAANDTGPAPSASARSGEATSAPAPPAPVADTLVAAGAGDERSHTERLIDDLLAPAAGEAASAMGRGSPNGDPLAAEPFLDERRALARQREALGVRKLAVEVAEDRLRALVEELEALKAEVDARLAELEAGDEARLARLVKLYEKMRPKDAARIFDDLDFEVLVPLALEMNERKLAPIVAAMTPEVARRLTGEVADRRADESLTAALAETRR